MKTFKYLLLILLFASLFVSCASDKSDGANNLKGVSQGYIIYKIEYPKDKNTSGLTEFLPKTIQLTFKDNSTRIDIVGLMKLFELNFIHRYQENSNISMYKMVDEKFCAEYDSVSFDKSFARMNDLTLEYGDKYDTLTICGLLCNKAVATLPYFNNAKINLYYTNELDLKNAQASTPLKCVDGVLLQFDIVMQGVYMTLKAQEIKAKEVDVKIFDVPSDYKKISNYEELDSIIKGWTDNFLK